MSASVNDDAFLRPAQQLLDALAEAVTGVPLSADRQWIESGSNTVVLLTGDVAVRIARQRDAGADLLRVQRVIDALPALPFAVPRSTGDAVEIDGIVAVPTQRIVGSMHPAGTGDPERLRSLLDAVHGIDPDALGGLAQPRSFLGGSGWQQKLAAALDVLESDVRAEARRRVDELIALPATDRTVVHGDLAGGNVLWADGRITGVIDWDFATRDDPAIDVAALAGWHGWGLADAFADASTVRRAAVFRRSAPLQALAFLVRSGRPAAEVDTFARRVEARLRQPDGR